MKILNGEKADEIVWTADIFYWLAGQRQAFNSFRGLDTEEGYLQFSKELGVVPYYWFPKFWLCSPEYKNVEVITEFKGHEKHTIYKTPVGQLEQCLTFLPSSCSAGRSKHFVQNSEDLKILLYILENRQLKPQLIDDYNERAGLWRKYDGIPAIGLPRSPLPVFLVEWVSVQDGVFLIFDHPELVKQILHLFEEQEAPIIDAVCELAPPLVHFPDNLTSETYAGLFEQYMAGPYERRLKRLHAANVRCAVHLDGTTAGLLPKLAAVGIDAIEAVTPKPAGDLDVEQMRNAAANENVVLWGGVPGAMFSEPYTWKEMEAHVEKTLRAWQRQPFVLGIADQIPPNGDITMIKKISDLVKSWKG